LRSHKCFYTAYNQSSPGPTLQQSYACRCSSVFYSLLSACAVCQSGGYISWLIYNSNCSTVYSGLFPGAIPAATDVQAWAYQNVTQYGTFNVSVAENAASGVVSLSPALGSSSASSQTPGFTQTTSSPINASEGSNKNGRIVWGVIGAVSSVSLFIGLAISYKIWRKRRRANSTAPPAINGHRYTPISPKTSQNTLFASANNGTRKHPGIITPGSMSLVSLPSIFYEPPEPSAYSPAVESSDMFGTSHGGHSPATERTVSLSHFVRLVPQRRPGGRW